MVPKVPARSSGVNRQIAKNVGSAKGLMCWLLFKGFSPFTVDRAVCAISKIYATNNEPELTEEDHRINAEQRNSFAPPGELRGAIAAQAKIDMLRIAKTILPFINEATENRETRKKLAAAHLFIFSPSMHFVRTNGIIEIIIPTVTPKTRLFLTPIRVLIKYMGEIRKYLGRCLFVSKLPPPPNKEW